jgi:hypothetical protein
MGVLSTPTYEPGLVTVSLRASFVLASNSPPPPPPIPSQATAGSSNGTIQLHTILAIVIGLGGCQHVCFHISLWNDKIPIPTLPSGLRHPHISSLIYVSAPLLPPTQRRASDLTTTTTMDTYQYPYDSPNRVSRSMTFNLFSPIQVVIFTTTITI